MSQKLKDEDKIKKRSLEEAVDQKKLPKGLGMARGFEYVCGKCASHLVFDTKQQDTKCGFCTGPLLTVSEWNEKKDEKTKSLYEQNVQPAQLIPFTIPKKEAADILYMYLSDGPQRRLHPNDLTEAANEDNIQGIYIPIWLMEIKTRSTWEAQSEFNIKDKSGKSSVRKETTSGFLEKTYANIFVRDSKGANQNLLKEMGRFSWDSLVNFKPTYLKGWAVEMYQSPLKKIFEQADNIIDGRVSRDVQNKVLGDRFNKDELDIQTEKNSTRFRLVLVPVWVSHYTYKKKKHTYMINGQTGDLGGEKPLDDTKIQIGVLALFIIFTLLFFLFRILT